MRYAFHVHPFPSLSVSRTNLALPGYLHLRVCTQAARRTARALSLSLSSRLKSARVRVYGYLYRIPLDPLTIATPKKNL